MHSDAYFERDGIYIDDLSIITYDTKGGTTSVEQVDPEAFSYNQFPNPASTTVDIRFEIPEDVSFNTARLTVYDAHGRAVVDMPVEQRFVADQLDVSHLPAGIYQSVIVIDGNFAHSERIVIAR